MVTVYSICYFPINIGWVGAFTSLIRYLSVVFLADDQLHPNTAQQHNWIHPYQFSLARSFAYLLEPRHLPWDEPEGFKRYFISTLHPTFFRFVFDFSAFSLLYQDYHAVSAHSKSKSKSWIRFSIHKRPLTFSQVDSTDFGLEIATRKSHLGLDLFNFSDLFKCKKVSTAAGGRPW